MKTKTPVLSRLFFGSLLALFSCNAFSYKVPPPGVIAYCQEKLPGYSGENYLQKLLVAHINDNASIYCFYKVESNRVGYVAIELMALNVAKNEVKFHGSGWGALQGDVKFPACELDSWQKIDPMLCGVSVNPIIEK